VPAPATPTCTSRSLMLCVEAGSPVSANSCKQGAVATRGEAILRSMHQWCQAQWLCTSHPASAATEKDPCVQPPSPPCLPRHSSDSAPPEVILRYPATTHARSRTRAHTHMNTCKQPLICKGRGTTCMRARVVPIPGAPLHTHTHAQTAPHPEGKGAHLHECAGGADTRGPPTYTHTHARKQPLTQKGRGPTCMRARVVSMPGAPPLSSASSSTSAGPRGGNRSRRSSWSLAR